jgi:hypothetical protein
MTRSEIRPLPYAAAAMAALAAACSAPPKSEPRPMRWFGAGSKAHSHNDYGRSHPLEDALREGFRSVEADVFLRDGELLVGHDEWMLHPQRTLERLYLDPLRQRIEQNGGSVHGDGETFLLLVDIKRDSAKVYARLREALAGRTSHLTRFANDAIEPGAITIVLSGDRPTAIVAAEPVRYVAIDGRIRDLEQDAPRNLVPLVSDAWANAFPSRSVDPMPEEEAARLAELAQRAHADGRMLRFWGAPDRVESWYAQQLGNVDWIGTDRPKDLARWLREQAAAR